MATAGGLWRGIGGVAVNAPALNLLRHPRRGPAWPIEPWRPLALAVLAGALSGGAGVGWQHWRLAQLQTQHHQVQAEAQAWAAQQKAAAALRSQSQLRQAALARAQDWQARQAQWLRLQDVLQAQASALGLRVLRWQADGRQQQLQAWLPRAQDVPALTSALSAEGPQVWTLQSLAEHAHSREGGVDVLLQAPWPLQAREKTKAEAAP